MAHKQSRWITPALIASVAVFLIIIIMRLWKVPQFFSFNFDEEYQAHLAWSIVKDFHIIWIGVSASNIGYYLGPGFTYLNWALFIIGKGDPVALAYFSALLGIATTASIYVVARSLYGNRAAFFASAFYGGSAFINYFDRRFWNPSPIPIISVWLLYSLYKARKDSRWFILTAILMAMSFHVHLALMVVWPVIGYYIVVHIRNISWKTWALMIGAYLLITSPLLVFDFVHNFDNMMAPLRFFQGADSTSLHTVTGSSVREHVYVFYSTLSRMWSLSPYTNIQEEHALGQHGNFSPVKPVFAIISICMLLWFAYRAWKRRDDRPLALLLLFFFLGFAFYPGYAAAYYELGFIALFPVVVGLIAETVPWPAAWTVLTVFLIANATVIFTTTQEPYGLTTKKSLINKISSYTGGKPFYLETYGKDPRKYHPYGGWRFLFKQYGHTPASSFADEYFGWLYQDEITNKVPVYRVVITEDVPYKEASTAATMYHEGAYRGYVIPTR